MLCALEVPKGPTLPRSLPKLDCFDRNLKGDLQGFAMRGLQRRVRQLAAVFVAALLVTAAVPEQGAHSGDHAPWEIDKNGTGDNAASRSDSAEDESPFGF